MTHLIYQRRLLPLLAAVLCSACLCSCKTTQQAVKEQPDNIPTHTTQKTLVYQKIVEEVTRQCPIALDQHTTLVKLDYREAEHTLVYQYLLSGEMYEEMDEQSKTVLQKAVTKKLQSELKNNSMVSDLRSEHLTLLYIYKDKNNKELCTVTLAPGEY